VHGLAGLREAMPGECRPPLSVVDERERRSCRRVVQNLVEQVQVVRMDIVLELAAVVASQPRPGDKASLLRPQTHVPLVLAGVVLAQIPREVADVPLRASAEESPLLERELLYRRHDLRRQSHRRSMRRGRLRACVSP
jgi:hypothetical protein